MHIPRLSADGTHYEPHPWDVEGKARADAIPQVSPQATTKPAAPATKTKMVSVKVGGKK